MKMNFSLITGTLVIDTEDVEVATETMSPKADFAGIIADKFGEVPHILFFSASPVEEFSCNDEDAVVDKLASARPALKKVRDTEIPLNAVDGKNIKIEEWAARMRLGIFAVPTVSDTNHLYNGVGIIRKE